MQGTLSLSAVSWELETQGAVSLDNCSGEKHRSGNWVQCEADAWGHFPVTSCPAGWAGWWFGQFTGWLGVAEPGYPFGVGHGIPSVASRWQPPHTLCVASRLSGGKISAQQPGPRLITWKGHAGTTGTCVNTRARSSCQWGRAQREHSERSPEDRL